MLIRLRRLAVPSAALLAWLLSGCSGGGSSTAGVRPVHCTTTTSKFCLVSCNLGCSNTGCSVSQIAQNQSILLTFSQAVDPTSVNSATVLLRTVTGEPPIGDLLVSGDTITFRPKIEIQGGTTFFGFRANETYVLTLPGGDNGGLALRSISGERLGATVSCQLIVSRGVIDLDNQPPVPTLIAPTETRNVSRGVTVVIEFSELIDVAPFSGSVEGGPIEYGVSRTVRSGNVAVCSDTAQPVPLPGVPRVTLDPVRGTSTVSFRPSVQLPAESCVEVRVTDRVRDLSGRAAQPVVYRFVTESAPPEDLTVVEEFDNDNRLDRSQSSTIWSNGLALPGVLGGSGKLGEFNPANGLDIGGGVKVWDTDAPNGILIPASQTLTGRDERVTDGTFEFSTFVVPAGTTVRFVGSKVPKIRVRGAAVIHGTVDVSAPPMAFVNALIPQNGQAGGAGGAGGGRGGNGSNSSNGTGGYHGANGEDVRVPAGHAYAGNIAGTGGRGAPQFPADRSAITHNYLTQNAQVPAGGSGGGFFAAGSPGVATRSPANPPELGPQVAGGIAFSLFPLPPNVSSLEHFLVGGSGGGGGGSHIYAHIAGRPEAWRVGAGGSGGGGAIAIRAGGEIQVVSAPPVVAFNVRGGDAALGYLDQRQGPPGPGGGGSGGSVLLQSAASIIASGIIDLTGGKGLYVAPGTLPPLNIETRGGDGAPGFVRAEMPGTPSISILQNVRPGTDPNMVGTLTDTDERSGFLTRWYATGQIFAPFFLRYEIEAEIDGVPVVFSDDETRGIWAPVGGGTPIEVLFQAGDVDPRDGSLVGVPTAWKSTVGAHHGEPGITGANIDGFRFTVIFNRRTGIVIRKVTVVYRV